MVTYIESSTGVSEGGRTGLTAVVVGLSFPDWRSSFTDCGCDSTNRYSAGFDHRRRSDDQRRRRYKWNDITEAIPAFLTIIAIPDLLNSQRSRDRLHLLSDLKTMTGRSREVRPLVYVLAVLFILRYVYLAGG
ncbi:MAG: hypothetical protein IPO77_02755 [Acidobacteria bacterium]|nr:hypothetical protein [Acidobacteriota bacterium]